MNINLTFTKENNQIIENTAPDEVYPLDFELINKAATLPNTNSKKEEAEKQKTLVY